MFNQNELIKYLMCPQTGEDLIYQSGKLQNSSASNSYEVNKVGIPLFVGQSFSQDAKTQEAHYDKVADDYIANIGYPHTQEYMRYLDLAFLELIENEEIHSAVEICCGKGEVFSLLGNRVANGFGVDVSTRMLSEAKKNFPNSNYLFLQADAIKLPLKNNTFSHVFMFGGIHHVNNRQQLFNEIYRILQPGGKFYWREPVSDFFVWKWIRAVIYRFSPNLDHTTERPLTYEETVPLLHKSGFKCGLWKTLGLLGFCFFMNSDVLVFNRLFRFIPGIRKITRFFIAMDKLMIKIPLLKRAGLQVIGCAEKIDVKS
jgi:ubiquinone/menaquinone biosynthesis C-methylase UbiE